MPTEARLRADDPVVLAAVGDGLGVGVVAATAKPLGEFSSHPIARLHLELADGRRTPAIFKQLLAHPHGLSAGQAGGKQVAREVLVYRRLLARHPALGAPALYASGYDPTVGLHWLVVEDVGPRRLDWCTYAGWEAAAQRLAGMHAAWQGRGDELRAFGCLVEHDQRFVAEQYAAALTTVAQRGPATALRRLRAADQAVRAVGAAVAAAPRTLVHGDVSGHNLAFDSHGALRPLDWEWAAVGGGAWDLVKLRTGWGRRKRDLDAAYRDALAAAGAPADPAALRRDVAAYQATKVLWYLRWWVDGCEQPAHLEALLDRFESSTREVMRG